MAHRTLSTASAGLVLSALILWAAGCAGPLCSSDTSPRATGSIGVNRVRLEHVALNVPDPVAMANWYCQNLQMKILRKGPPPVNMHFIADSQNNMMLELYHNPRVAVPDYRTMDPLVLHIAFMVDDVPALSRKLVAAGATIVEPLNTTAAGDQITILRDPWGIPIQLLKRANPMLQHR